MQQLPIVGLESAMDFSYDMTFEEYEKSIHTGDLNLAGNCPVNALIRMLQGKWRLIIIYQLCLNEPLRFVELKKSVVGITNAVLTTSLRELIDDGFITRTQYTEIPPRVEYSLTEKGRAFTRVFYEMTRWVIKYMPCDNSDEKK